VPPKEEKKEPSVALYLHQMVERLANPYSCPWQVLWHWRPYYQPDMPVCHPILINSEGITKNTCILPLLPNKFSFLMPSILKTLWNLFIYSLHM
jgi:hypothetical protein